jgi:hypothetical protein
LVTTPPFCQPLRPQLTGAIAEAVTEAGQPVDCSVADIAVHPAQSPTANSEARHTDDKWLQ